LVLGLREAQAAGGSSQPGGSWRDRDGCAHPPSRTPSRRSIDRRHGSSVSRCRQAARAADGAIAQASLLLRLLSAGCGMKRTYRDSLLFFGVRAPWRC